ncbi:uncharacterized protein LOC132066163 [Lycium ferocissimum]|uniref:uncharacterized protein LOC132066163 n=1 Tax=Lycium ferocissimum TaxID=112874 RepID=UPI0028162508|nr:uncharacterized protein LOC132066163 [Lycium ferocissimum]
MTFKDVYEARSAVNFYALLEGSFVDDYKKLEAYGQEVGQSNHGTDVVITISRSTLEKVNEIFEDVHMDALKKGWKGGLRPLIGVDGTFLKGRYKGQMLVALAQDSMNQFYPLAWAVMSLELKDGQGVTFISDMQKGLVDAVKNTLPNSHHRYCVRHIEANWQKKWRSGQMKKLMWWCAWSTYEEEFKDQLKKLGELSKEDNYSAAKDLLHYPPQSWCRAYLDTKCKNMMLEECQSSGSLEEIRTKVIRLLVKNEDEIRKWDGGFSPESLKLYDDYRAIAHYCKVEYNGDYGYEISEGEDRHNVDLSQKRCTCRVWQLSGIPCPHAIKAILYDKGEPMDEMHWFYNKEAYSLTYKNKLQPVRGQQFWKITEAQAMEPPDVAKTVGRQA